VKDSLAVDPRTIAAFVAVADKLSFRRAAACLNISQPVVSRRLAVLEQKYGLRLVRRDSRSVALTPDGERFLPVAHELLRQLGAAHREMSRLAGAGFQVPPTGADQVAG